MQNPEGLNLQYGRGNALTLRPFFYLSVKKMPIDFIFGTYNIQLLIMDKYEITLNEIKHILSRLVGTQDQPKEKQFSEQALDNAAKAFKKLKRGNSEWVPSTDVSKYIKGAPYNNVGNFIRKEFEFKSFYQKGAGYFYYKKDLIHLSNELAKRNINLSRYMELKAEQERIEKGARDTFALRKEKKAIKNPYKIPDNLRNIAAKPKRLKTAEQLTEELDKLNMEYNTYHLSEYINIFDGSLALPKDDFYFQKMDSEISKRAKRWFMKFNSIHNELSSLEKSSKKK